MILVLFCEQLDKVLKLIDEFRISWIQVSVERYQFPEENVKICFLEEISLDILNPFVLWVIKLVS